MVDECFATANRKLAVELSDLLYLQLVTHWHHPIVRSERGLH
jgi:hypothetical protein